jgi:hypothetical protein
MWYCDNQILGSGKTLQIPLPNNQLSVGTHTIGLIVKDDEGYSSQMDNKQLKILRAVRFYPSSFFGYTYKDNSDDVAESENGISSVFVERLFGLGDSWAGSVLKFSPIQRTTIRIKADISYKSEVGSAGIGAGATELRTYLDQLVPIDYSSEISPHYRQSTETLSTSVDVENWLEGICLILDLIPGLEFIHGITTVIDLILAFWSGYHTGSINIEDLRSALDNGGGDHKNWESVDIQTWQILNNPNTLAFIFRAWTASTSGKSGVVSLINNILIEEPSSGPNSDLRVTTSCPVDILIIDPINRAINKTHSAIPGAKYNESLANDGQIHDQVIIPASLKGNYSILVIPESGANLTDNYTLTISFAGNKSILAQYQYIAGIPDEPYIFNVNSPNIPSLPEGNTVGVFGRKYNFTTFTTNFDGQIVYYLWDWGDGNASWYGPCNSSDICNASHTWSEVGNYEIKVKSKLGIESNWSLPLNITIIDMPPEITNVQANPSRQTGGGYVNISASVTDNSEVNQVYLFIQYPDNTIENFSIKQNSSDNIFYCNRTYEQGLQYTYYIWANDTSGNTNVSDLHNFLINNAPFTPNNPDPINGETGISVDKIISWDGGDPDIGDSVLYDVYFGTTSPPPKVDSNLTSAQYQPNPMTINTTYYWKIVSWDTCDASTSGPIWSFTSRTNKPPFIPSSPNPENNSIDVEQNIILQWFGGDPENDSVTYDVYFGLTSSPTKVASNVTLNHYDPGPLQSQKTYFWKIVAWDEFGATTSGQLWTFTTKLHLFSFLFFGLINNVNDTGKYTNFKAQLLLAIDLDNTLPTVFKSGEDILVSKENQYGYIGKRFIIGIFDGTVISKKYKQFLTFFSSLKS